MCPVFRAMGEELGCSRAKANLLAFWASGQLRDEDFESAEFRKFLDLCVNCKACVQQCPSGVDVPGMVTFARAEYVRRKGLRRAERLLSGNRFLSILGSVFGPVANFFMGLGVFKRLLDRLLGIDKQRAMPHFSRGSFLKVGRRYLAACEPIAEPVDKVAYFVDTYANYNDHELGFAVVDVLRAIGVDVILPKQLPAPLPAITYGDVKRAKKYLAYSVRHLAEAVRDGYKIVCSEPSAALCLKDEMKRYVSGADAELVAENTFELMTYLLDLYEAGQFRRPAKSISEKFVYHLPCHLCIAGQEGASIKLIQELCKAEVVDLKAGCCGLAGTYGMQKKNYELSTKIAENLKNALESSPCKNILTECAACGMQIQHISDCTVRHPIKVLAEAYSE
jgi:Fe-S oxidoreductase